LIAHGMEWALMVLPLALYLLYLGLGVNRRPRPAVVSGPRNFLGLAAALSGFLLLGPASWIAFPFRSFGAGAYWVAYALYLVVLAFAGWRLHIRARRQLVVLNVNPHEFAEVLPEALDGLGVPYAVVPGRIALDDGKATVDLETSFVFQSVTLTWQGEAGPHQANLAAALRKALADQETFEHHSAMLLTFAGVVLASFVTFAMTLYVVLLLQMSGGQG
jgi:hypothetical protein